MRRDSVLRRVENAEEMVARRQNSSEKSRKALKNLKKLIKYFRLASKKENFGETNKFLKKYTIT